MNEEVFAEWLKRQGYHIIRSESSWWYNAGPRVYQAFPYDWLIHPSDQELKRLMLRRNIIAIRYSTDLSAAEGMVSYHVILKNPYSLDMLRTQARNGVRRGLQNFTIELIPFSRLADEGWKLQWDTLDRQGRIDSMSQSQWQKICLAAEGLEGFEAWGAISDGNLAAALITARIGNTCYVPYALSHRSYLNLHVNNALFFTVSQTLLGRKGVEKIFYTLHSLDAPESIDEFKFRMGLTPIPVRQRVDFHPFLRPLIGNLSHRVIIKLRERYPSSSVISKMEGLVRFYRNGKLPLAQQEWQKCIEDHRKQWLKIV